jgi:hypothetical protein
MFNAIRELYWTLADAWKDADLWTRLQEWWYVVRNPQVVG